MPHTRRQFHTLYRDFLLRLVDPELLATGGDSSKLFARCGAFLAAFSLVFAIPLPAKYELSILPPEQLALAAWGDQEFFFAMTIAAAGMFAVIAWDAVLLSRRDLLVLGLLPVRVGTMFRAKIAALATGLGICVGSINVFLGLVYPQFLIRPGPWVALGAMRSYLAYWTTVILAGAFVFAVLLAVQGIASLVFPYRLFLRISNLLQMAAFFAILGLFFLTPGPSQVSAIAPKDRDLVLWLPSYWFLGLFQELNGPVHPAYGGLAERAVVAITLALVFSGTAFTFAFFRDTRRLIEMPDVVPSRGRKSDALAWVVNRWIRKPLDRAVLLFAARTIARSRQHRMLLAVYAGVALAIVLAVTKSVVYGQGIDPRLEFSYGPARWDQPNVPLLGAGFIVIQFAVVGLRAVFALPATLKANWVFRATLVSSPKAYLLAIRRAAYALGVLPAGVVLLAIYFALWPPGPVVFHATMLAGVAVILVERRFHEFAKIPFACSYLPGKAGGMMAVAGIVTVATLLVGMVAMIEYGAMRRMRGIVTLLVIVTGIAAWSRRRWAQFAGQPFTEIQFDDAEVPEVSPLTLNGDGSGPRNYRYIDVAQ